MKVLTPELVLSAYSLGLFPMANDREDRAIHWIDPIRRGILPIDRFHVPRRLARTIRREPFELRIDEDFPAVIHACAAATDERPRTWLNDEMIALYIELWKRGHCHSIACWRDGMLVGGLYGLAIGGAFFGESMFSRARDASKIALVELWARLHSAGFQLLDTQFVTPHLQRFGAIEITRRAYRLRLRRAIAQDVGFPREPYSMAPRLIGMRLSGSSGSISADEPASATGSPVTLQSTTQTS